MNGLDHICIEGGVPLCGSVRIQGSKNAVLPMMAASFLHPGISVLKGCPKIADVFCMEEILQKLGAVTWWEGHDLYLDCSEAKGTKIPQEYAGKMRSSVILLGVMAARNKHASMGYPGGCVIGKRPIDLHLMVLEKLGAQMEEGTLGITASCTCLNGNEIVFPKKSVGATQQGILAAVTARGTTCLYNCAREPEVSWLCRYLRIMGAKIKGEGSDCIRIEGVHTLKAGEIQVPPDRIVAGTYICAAAITRGEIFLENPPEGELDAFLEVYRKMGGQYKQKSGKLLVNGKSVCRSVLGVETESFPGFPTDLQSPLMAVLATIPGRSCICENIFEDRFRIAEQLEMMGAHIRVKGSQAMIEGGFPLKGCRVRASELRGGAALVLAGLAAQGETLVEGYSFIRRGYENICKDLGALGGVLAEKYRNESL